MVNGSSRLLHPLKLTLPVDVQVDVSADVLRHFQQHIQRRCFDKEAGGQLFAAIRRNVWSVAVATGPRPSDYRTRFGFRPDRAAERAEIQSLFEKGLHYVGDWHTHPQNVPRPSWLDLRSMKQMAEQSVHSLPGFLMAVVGRSDTPNGIWWSFHSREGWHQQVMPQDLSL